MAIPMPIPNRILKEKTQNTVNRTISAKFGDGYSQTAADGTFPKEEKWTVTWGGLTDAQRDIVINALDQVGGWEALIWSPYLTPTGGTYEAHYKVENGEYSVEWVGNTWKITCNVYRVPFI